MILPPPISFDTAATDLERRVADLAPGPGIYRIVPKSGQMHVGVTRNLVRRVTRIGRTFGSAISQVDCWTASSELHARLLLYSATKSTFPKDYLHRLRLRLPWFLVLTESDAYPQLAVTNRRLSAHTVAYGPFASRDHAALYEERVESLFQIRRCPGTLEPSPEHAGCIYGEMNQCCRPCQCAVTPEEYATEVRRVAEFLQTKGRRLVRTLLGIRDQASQSLNFELAAQTHKQLERVNQAVSAREDIVVDIHNFSGIAILPGPIPKSCCLHTMFHGSWQLPIIMSYSNGIEQGDSMDSELRRRFQQLLGQAAGSPDTLEHLAIFQRWYRSTWRTGEWLPFTTVQDLNYRKLVRHISKVVREQPSAPPLPH